VVTKQDDAEQYREPVLDGHRRARPGRSKKTALLVAQQIVAQITRDGLAPGAKLASEREMLAQYDVGRGTLRESLRFLEMQGVITMKPGPGGGPQVNTPDAQDFGTSLALFMQLLSTPFGSIVEARQLLEPAMAAQAAQRGEAVYLDQIRDSVEKMEASLDDENEFLRQNEIFHDAIAWSSGNPLFGLLTAALHWITDGTALGVDYPETRRDAVVAAHRAIYEAIAAGDAEVARIEMSRHIDEFARYLQRYYPKVWDSAVRWDTFG
jgi:GntR family transcriptional regulator, transcriptional repressor for pyruvate dehydrogenase complex